MQKSWDIKQYLFFIDLNIAKIIKSKEIKSIFKNSNYKFL